MTVNSRGVERREFCCCETIEKIDAVNVLVLVMIANVDGGGSEIRALYGIGRGRAGGGSCYCGGSYQRATDGGGGRGTTRRRQRQQVEGTALEG